MSSFLNVPVRRGEIVYERVTVGELPDGSPVQLPVATVGGVAEGPTVYLQAGIHGDELTGIEVCRRALASLDPASLSGTVVAIPVANVPAHLTRTRGYLHEERWLIDINRVFPGNPHGLLTERIADILMEQFVHCSDLSIDLHAALDGCDILPFVYIDPNDDDNGTLRVREECGLAFGAPYVYFKSRQARLGTSDMTRSISSQSDAAGSALISAEMGESRRVSTQVVPIGVRGVRNVLAHLEMLDEEPVRYEEPRSFREIHLVHALHGGGLRMSVDLGDDVSAGQQVGEVVDIFGRRVELLTAPVDGFVLRVMRLGSVSTGAEVAWVCR